MHKLDFWTQSGNAMEQSIEGNRWIVKEIADAVRALWKRMIQLYRELLREQARHQHLPPV